MKNFRVTVNGNVYDVAVEELAQGAVAQQAPVVAQPVVQAPVAPVAPVAQPTAASAAAPANGEKITSPMPGTILDLKVKVGDSVSQNQVVAILEAMKMENEIVTPVAGKVLSVSVNKGAAVDTGDLLIVIG